MSVDSENSVLVSKELATRELAQHFIVARMKNAALLESVKSIAITQLLKELKENVLPLRTLLNTVEKIDSVTEKDMNVLASSNSNGKSGEVNIFNYGSQPISTIQNQDQVSSKFYKSLDNLLVAAESITARNTELSSNEPEREIIES